MNKIITKRISAIIICLALVFMTGCGGSGNSNRKSGDIIRLSNIYTMNSKLSSDEEKMLQAVEDCFSKAYVEPAKTFDVSTSECILNLENTTEYDLYGYIYTFVLTNDNMIVTGNRLYLDMNSGDKAALPISCYDSTGTIDEGNAKLCFQVEFVSGRRHYQTSTIELNLDDIVGKATFSPIPNQNPTIVFDRYDPASYIINDFFVQEMRNSSYNLCFSLTKTSGDFDAMNNLLFRVVNQDGVVVCSDTQYAYYLDTGDTFILCASYVYLPKGNYTVELAAA